MVILLMASNIKRKATRLGSFFYVIKNSNHFQEMVKKR